MRAADSQLKALLQVFVIQTENSAEIVNMHIVYTVFKQRLLVKQVETKRNIAKPFFAEEALQKIEVSSRPKKRLILEAKQNESLFDSSITSQKPLV